MLSDTGEPHQTLVRALKGHADAIAFVQALVRVCDVWDDLIDGDADVPPHLIHQAFWLALVTLPGNPFYLQHRASLHPLIVTGIASWWAANDLEERRGARARAIAYTARSQIADVITMACGLVGGPDWMKANAADIKLMIHSDDPAAYAREMESKHGMVVHS